MAVFDTLFQNKKVTQQGLGLLGRGVGDAMWLAKAGAELRVVDVACERFDIRGSSTTRFLITRESEQFRMHLARQLGGLPHTIELV